MYVIILPDHIDKGKSWKYCKHPVQEDQRASSLVSVGSPSVAIYVSGMPSRLLYGASFSVIFHGDRTPWFIRGTFWVFERTCNEGGVLIIQFKNEIDWFCNFYRNLM